MKELIQIPAQGQNERLVSVNNGQAVTSSLRVAEYFGKRHSDVIRQINNLIQLNAKLRSGYVLTTYEDSTKKKNVMYLMNRDGFTLLAMGFTGKKALDFKIAYIKAFNEMEEMLRKQESTRYAEKLLRKQVKQFGETLYNEVKGNAKYLPYDCLAPSIVYLNGSSFEENLQNVFAQIRNAYLSGMHAAGNYFRTEKELKELKSYLSGISYEMRKRSL